MFKKKPNIKTLAPLRSSDRRKICDQIISEYRVEIPKQALEEDDPNKRAESAANIGAIRSSLLPDGAQWAKFSTTVGAELNTVSGTVYTGGHDGEEQRILWFKVDERIYPTVYTLWKHPNLLPLLHTSDAVLRKMRGGADLMTPGLALGPPFPVKATKGSTVAVAATERPSVPSLVGNCEIDISSLTEVQGTKGHAVRSLHWVGDELWSWGSISKSGVDAPDHIVGWGPEHNGSNVSIEAILGVSISDPENTAPDTAGHSGSALDGKIDKSGNGISGDSLDTEDNLVRPVQRSVKDVDEAFKDAFLYAVHHYRSKNPEIPRHGLEFPMPQSRVISDLILPFLPLHTSDDAAYLQIKKTSWKTPKKFIKFLEKEGLLKSKDRKEETLIQEIEFDNAAVIYFKPYKLPKKDNAVTSSGDNRTESSNSASQDPSIGQRLKMLVLLKPTERLAPIFPSGGSSAKSFYLLSEARSVVMSYIESEDIVSSTNKRLININPIIANAVFDGQSALDREVLAKGTVPRDALVERIIEGCTRYWAILRSNEIREDAKPKAGNPPSIKITLETRSGTKTVTKVSGLEVFSINPSLLADELQKACASSTSVGQLVGSSPKLPVMELIVQGPQKEMVTRALEKRGVQRNWIEVLDRTKGKKK